MTLRILDGGRTTPHAPSKADLKIIHRNRDLDASTLLDVEVWVRLFPPAYAESIILDDGDLVSIAKDFYADLPHTLRHTPPFDGMFELRRSGFTGKPELPRRYADFTLMHVQAYYREEAFYASVKAVELALARLSMPWSECNWGYNWGTYIGFQPEKTIPPWLVRFCAKREIKMVPFTPAYEVERA